MKLPLLLVTTLFSSTANSQTADLLSATIPDAGSAFQLQFPSTILEYKLYDGPLLDLWRALEIPNVNTAVHEFGSATHKTKVDHLSGNELEVLDKQFLGSDKVRENLLRLRTEFNSSYGSLLHGQDDHLQRCQTPLDCHLRSTNR